MRVPFRQGIVRCLDAGFLTVNSNYVSLNVLDTPTVIAIAHGSTDYLFVEQRSAPNAWGPITPGVDQWLYWDLNTTTAARTFGITTLRPVIQHNAPTAPINDQHWFDTSSGTMKVWNGTAHRWVEKIRVFACELNDGGSPLSMSDKSPDFKGTQIGVNQPCLAGVILTDVATGKPLRTADNKFLTGETRLRAVTGATSSLRTEAIICEAEAQENMAAYTIVRFIDFGKIVASNQFTVNAEQQFGVIENAANIGDIVTVTTTGVISNPNWEWSAVNSLLYSDEHGQMTTVPLGNSAPIGIVIDVNKILLFAANRASSGDGTSAPASSTTSGTVKLSVPAVDPNNPIAVGDNDPRIINALSKTGGIMTGPLTLYEAPIDANHAATKSYVDASLASSGSVVTKVNTDTTVLQFGTPVHSSMVGGVAKASANTASTADLVGLIVDTEVGTGTPGQVQTAGIMTGTTGQWDAVTEQAGGLIEGAIYYLNVAPAGRITTTAPTTPGQYLVIIGVALSPTQMFINTQASILL